jgi:Uma2 family endonuclease
MKTSSGSEELTMLEIDLKRLPTSEALPTGEELPCSDDIPVDNENQNLLPNILLFLLEFIWRDRQDWFFAVDMGLYHTTGASPRVPVVPDGFLCLGVPRWKPSGWRDSYVMWEEDNVAPMLCLEVVSKTKGKEYAQKVETYRRLGVLYYVILNLRFHQRDGHPPLEVYKLVDGHYELQSGEPVWMPEIGLGIGRCVMSSDPLQRQVLGWFDEQGVRYLSPEEQVDRERQAADRERRAKEEVEQQMIQEQQSRERLEAYLRSQGIDPDQIP